MAVMYDTPVINVFDVQPTSFKIGISMRTEAPYTEPRRIVVSGYNKTIGSSQTSFSRIAVDGISDFPMTIDSSYGFKGGEHLFLYAKLTDGTVSNTVEFDTPIIPIEKITFNNASKIIVERGKLDKTLLLENAVIEPANASVLDGTRKRVKYSVADTSIAEIDNFGVIYGKKRGKTKISVLPADSVNIDTAKFVTEIEVTQPVEAVNFESEAITIFRNASVELFAEVSPKSANNKGVIYSFETPYQNIATLDGNVLKGVNVGSTVVVATSEEDSTIKAKLIVTVKAKPSSSSFTYYKECPKYINADDIRDISQNVFIIDRRMHTNVISFDDYAWLDETTKEDNSLVVADKIRLLFNGAKEIFTKLNVPINELNKPLEDAPSKSQWDELIRILNDLHNIINDTKTWQGIKRIVRMGLGESFFPVGHEFTTLDTDTNQNIIWVVRAHNHHKTANSGFKYTMTLETQNVYSLSNGVGKMIQYDNTEALYYAVDELPAGTYNFTLPVGYDTTHGGGKTLSFTLTKSLQAGGIIMFPWGSNAQSTSTQITTYASNAATVAIESVAVTEAADGISLGTADGNTENVNHAHRIRYGSNNYAQSAVRQWLNSNAKAGSVWTPTNVFDRPASWSATHNGFMHGLPADFLSAVQPAIIPCSTNFVFEVNSLDGTNFTTNEVYELQDKFFLLSRPEIFGDWDDTNHKDGTQLEYYNGLTATERIKKDTAGTAKTSLLRSSFPYSASTVRIIDSSGKVNASSALYSNAVAPACIIA